MTTRIETIPELLSCPCGAAVDTDECPYPHGRNGLYAIACANPDCRRFAVGRSPEDAVTVWNATALRVWDWRAFSARNLRRCTSPDGFNHALESWSLSDWMTATVGELGEAANVLKKLNRARDGVPGNDKSVEELQRHFAHELADTFIYLDLLAQAAGIDLPAAVDEKFRITSAKRGYVED